MSVIIIVYMDKKHIKTVNEMEKSRFDLLVEYNKVVDNYERIISKANKDINYIYNINEKNKLTIRKLKSNIVELKQEKKKLLDRLNNN